MNSLTNLKNLGEKSARMLIEAGIKTEADLRRMGAVEAYRRVKHVNPGRVSLLMLYALQGALMDLHWSRIPDDIKADLKRQVS